jgi:hypothetical protein
MGSFNSEQVPEVGKDYFCTSNKFKIKVAMKEKIRIYSFHGSDYLHCGQWGIKILQGS